MYQKGAVIFFQHECTVWFFESRLFPLVQRLQTGFWQIYQLPCSVRCPVTCRYLPEQERIHFLCLSHTMRTVRLWLLTESAYVNDSEKFLSVIEKVNQKGFIIKMDDIGSGYSSLNTPSELHIDVMKLDLKFLRQTEDNRRHQKVVEFVRCP